MARRTRVRLCPAAGCPNVLVDGEACPEHGSRWDRWRAADPARSRGYGAGWRRARKAALDRAGHRCEICGETSGLQAHHVDGRSPADPGANQLSNLQVLCLRHHRLAEVDRRRQQPR